MNYTETIQYLYDSLPVFHRTGKAAYKANLNNSLALDEYFGHPHSRYKTVHIAGTNGKGSVSHILAAILQSTEYRTGLYTSPHLRDFRERIKINGQEITEQEVVDFVENHRDIIGTLQPSFFEITSAMAFDCFARQQADIAVIETGLGGRLDSTNIITPALSVITNIGLEHTEFLGDTLEKIAAEKAGIIKPEIPAVVGEWQAETAPVFEAAAMKCRSPLYFAERCLRVVDVKKDADRQIFTLQTLDNSLFSEHEFTVSLDLLGDYQRKNIITALVSIAVLRKNGFNMTFDNVTKACASAARITALQGRWQTSSSNPMLIFDTGHNAHGMAQVIAQLQETPYRKLYMVFGVVNDKDINAIVSLLPREAYYFFTQANIPRAMNVETLAETCMSAGLQGEIQATVPKALAAAKNKASDGDIIFVGGSSFVVAEAL